MSLVNQMLQDLQERKAADSKPLNGLRAVPTGMHASQDRPSWRWRIVALSVSCMAVVVVLGVYIQSGFGDDPQQLVPPAAQAVSTPAVPASAQGIVSMQPDSPAETSTGSSAVYPLLASLATNRLDYHLRSRPVQRKVRPAVAASKKLEVQKGPAGTGSDRVEVAVKKVVDPVSRLRRDGLAALRAGQAVAAENHFEKLVLIDPSDPEPHLYLHAALKAQSRDEAARNALVEGLKLTATPSRLAKVLAHDFLAAGLVDSALTVLTRHRPADADDPDYDANLAAVNQRAGHHTAAAELYLRLVADQPANGDWWVGLAISQEAQGLLQDATRSFATAAAAGTLDLRLARYAAERLEELEKGS